MAALNGHPSPGAVSLLLTALGDSDWRVRKEATAVATSLAPPNTVLARLVELLSAPLPDLGPNSGDDVGLRNAAVEAIGRFGAEAVAELGRALPGFDADARKLAVEALGATAHPASIGLLGQLTRDPDINVRMAAIEAIAAVGWASPDESLRLLTECLDAAGQMERLAALEGLNSLAVPIAWEQIEQLARDPILNAAVCEAASRSRRPQAARLLVERALTTRGTIVPRVLRALAEYIGRGPDAYLSTRRAYQESHSALGSALLELISCETENPELRGAALITAGALELPEAGALATEVLTEERLAMAAEKALKLLGDEGARALVACIRTGSAASRVAAFELLSHWDSLPPDVLGVVRVALGDSDEESVRAALRVLSRIGDARCLDEVLAESCRQDSCLRATRVRTQTTATLRALALKFPERAQELVLGLSPNTTEAASAATILGALGETSLAHAPQAANFLELVLSNEEPHARQMALEAMASLGPVAPVDAIAFALSDEERSVRAAAVRTLGRLCRNGPPHVATEHLRNLVRHSPDMELVNLSLHALGEQDDNASRQLIESCILLGNPRTAVAAIAALVAGGSVSCVPVLTRALERLDASVVNASLVALADELRADFGDVAGGCLEHGDREVRMLTAELLGRFGQTKEAASLRTRLDIEEDLEVRDTIRRSLDLLTTSTSRPPRARA